MRGNAQLAMVVSERVTPMRLIIKSLMLNNGEWPREKCDSGSSATERPEYRDQKEQMNLDSPIHLVSLSSHETTALPGR